MHNTNILRVHVKTPPDEFAKVTDVLADATQTVEVHMPTEGEPFADIDASAVAENAVIAAGLVQQLMDRGCIMLDWAYGLHEHHHHE